jgi:hypothetical protein
LQAAIHRKRAGKRYLRSIFIGFNKFEVGPKRWQEYLSRLEAIKEFRRGAVKFLQIVYEIVVRKLECLGPITWQMRSPMAGKKQVYGQFAVSAAEFSGEFEGDERTHAVPIKGEGSLLVPVYMISESFNQTGQMPESFRGVVVAAG